MHVVAATDPSLADSSGRTPDRVRFRVLVSAGPGSTPGRLPTVMPPGQRRHSPLPTRWSSCSVGGRPARTPGVAWMTKAPREETAQADGGPRVFISYSHDSEEHKGWVLKLATDLRRWGVDAVLDRWDLGLGEDLPSFMTRGISNAKRVILVCTEEYVAKANDGSGGVGYESLIITAGIYKNTATTKFLPVVRQDEVEAKLPQFMEGRFYVDFSDDASYSDGLEALVREIHGTPSSPKPPLGANPFEVQSAGKAAGTSSPHLGVPALPLTSLDDGWFERHANVAISGLGNGGAMELRFGLDEPVDTTQSKLLQAARSSQILTFGWPFGVVVDGHEQRPRPVPEGIVAEVSLDTSRGHFRNSYDYWALGGDGRFYLLQSLFEDRHAKGQSQFDTRMRRVAEALMYCGNLYRNLGVADEATMLVRVSHLNLGGRTLSATGSRDVSPTQLTPGVTDVRSELVTSNSDLRRNLTRRVEEILKRLFVLFDFMAFAPKIYEDVVGQFVSETADPAWHGAARVR